MFRQHNTVKKQMTIPKKILPIGLFLMALSGSLTGSPIAGAQMPFSMGTQSMQLAGKPATDQMDRGIEQFRKGDLKTALATFQQVLVSQKETVGLAENESTGIANTLTYLGRTLSELGQYDEAVEALQQAQKIYHNIGAEVGEGEVLTYLGEVSLNVGRYSQALQYLQQALAIHQTANNRAGEGEALYNLGEVYNRLSSYDRALETLQQALAIRREVDDGFGEGRTLQNIGIVYRRIGQYDQALEFYQQALTLNRQTGDRIGEGRTLAGMGLTHDRLGQYELALDMLKQALTVRQAIGDRSGESGSLIGIGRIYNHLGEYDQALAFYQQALEITEALGDKPRQAGVLNNLAGVHGNLAHYSRALELYQQAATAFKALGNKAGEARTLSNLGFIYSQLGEQSKALTFFQQALEIRRAIGDRQGEGATLHSMGLAYDGLQQYPKALQVLQQGLEIRREIRDRAGEAASLSSLGLVYEHSGQNAQALEYHQQALEIFQALDNQPGLGRTLNSLGVVYHRLGKKREALETIQHSLKILRQLGDKAGERIALGNIGYLLEEQNRPALAITFYKQSVNTTEAIRKNLRAFSREQQQTYTDTVAGTYRRLADLLLKRDRVIEAQQVLDLLKLQELDDYLNNVRGNDRSAEGLITLPQEQQILDDYNAVQAQSIHLSKELARLRKIPVSKRTQSQKQRLSELRKVQQTLRQDFNDFIRSPEVVALTQQLNQTTGGENLDLPNLKRLQRQLRQAEQSTVVLYPLVLANRLELVLVTADAPPIRRSVAVNREVLNQTILDLRSTLTDRSGKVSKSKMASETLYNWLIQPIEADLRQAKAKTILYAPDGQLRYVPLAALYDGSQWLVERFDINNITAATLTDLAPQPPNDLRVLAAAFTQGSYEFEVGTRQFAFAGLLFARPEVENIATKIPTTTKFLDDDFSEDEIVPQMNDHNVVHFATHAAFVPGNPINSFILFGNGGRATLDEIETWDLTDVDLIVLSACQTAVGGWLDNGEEILGLGYQMQQAGALATVATLWIVDDEGTKLLMDAFYNAIQQRTLSKSEALRQAQLSLINGKHEHPYYWAPFILIGNGL